MIIPPDLRQKLEKEHMIKTLNTYINWGRTDYLSEHELKRLHFINAISLIAGVACIISLIPNYLGGNFYMLPLICLTTLSFGFVVVLNKLEKHVSATFLFIGSPFVFAFYQVFLYGEAMSIEYIFLLIPLASFLLFEEVSNRIIVLILSILTVIALKFLPDFFPPAFTPGYKIVLQIFMAISAILIGFFLMQVFQNDTIKARRETQEALNSLRLVNMELISTKEALEKKNLELQAEIQLKEIAIQATKESERRYEVLFENGFEGLMLVNLKEKKIISCNHKLFEFFKIKRNQLLNADLMTVLQGFVEKPFDFNNILNKYFSELDTKGKVTFEGVFKNQLGEQQAAQITVVKLPAPQENQAIAIFKNTTEQWLAKKKILAANAELTNFAHAASHDMKEPLRMINSFSGLLKKRIPNDFESQEFLNFIVDASDRMNTLVQDLLEYATTGTAETKSQKLDLNEVVFVVNNNLHLKIEETQAEIYAEELPTICANSTLINQLFQNIISNGLKFQQPGLAPKICVQYKHTNQGPTFSIKDNGIGIDPVNQAKIFNVFTRLHSKTKYEGSGIGLATCKKIIDYYGGNIWVESMPNKGTTFFFTLPKAFPAKKKVPVAVM